LKIEMNFEKRKKRWKKIKRVLNFILVVVR
jgi:hypothetical protein